MAGKADFKRRRLQMFPGDIPLRDKIAMLEGDRRRLDPIQTRLEEVGMGVDLSRTSRRYKKEFARKANRKVRYAAIEVE